MAIDADRSVHRENNARMSVTLTGSDIMRARIALAREAYRSDTVRLVQRDIATCTHVVATRVGLYGISSDAAAPVLIMPGFFYGVTVVGDHLYIFEACDRPRSPTRRGRIVRLTVRGGTVLDADIVATGLDNGCHQIDVIDGLLCILDTYSQKIVRIALDGRSIDEIAPFATAAAGDWAGGYLHINSLLAVDDGILLVLHLGGTETGRPSECAVLDRDWTVRDRTPLAGFGCHNIVVMPDGRMLGCGSLDGELIASDGNRVKIGDMMTRGLSVDARTIVVGGSTLCPRGARDAARGSVSVLDHQFRQLATIDLPAPVCDIRRIDGNDYSLSAHRAGAVRQTG